MRTGISKAGKPWTMQDCECMILDDTGAVSQVGVLNLPRNMVGDAAPKPGLYSCEFRLVANLVTRHIEAQLLSLVPVAKKSSI